MSVIGIILIVLLVSSAASLLLARWLGQRNGEPLEDATLRGELAQELRDLDETEVRSLLRVVRRMKQGRDTGAQDQLIS
jgi:hypothetical protein